MLGIGGIVGAGIFALVGTAAAGDENRPGAGPALVVSFLLTAVACSFAALCYAEFASISHVSGSAYSYAYATLGELVAWIIGWDLVLEYAVGNVAVAISWSGYFQDLIGGFLRRITGISQMAGNRFSDGHGKPGDSGSRSAGVRNARLQSICRPCSSSTAITALLVIGIKESSWFNTIMVAIKLVVLAFFLIVGTFYVKPEN